MHLSHLRRRFLIAMGVPALGTTWAACASPPPPDDPTDPRLGQTTTLQIAGDPDTTAGDTQSGGGAQVATGARPCGPDEILETICGSVAAPGQHGECGNDGANLTAYGASQIFLTRFTAVAHDPAFKGWPYSEEGTARYHATMTGPPEGKQNYCCYDHCTDLHAGDRGVGAVPRGFVPSTTCIPFPSTTRHPAPGAPACPAAIEVEGQMRAIQNANGAQCCYLVPRPAPQQWHEHHNRGRPLRVAGTPALSDLSPRADWQSSPILGAAASPPSHPRLAHSPPLPRASNAADRASLAADRASLAADTVPRAADTAPLADTVLPSTDTASLPADVRAALAAAWQEEARMEHASVAAFAKLSLDLLAFGAPPDLITRAHEAAMEEVTHAQLTFSLASAYAGTPIGPAPLRQAASAGHDPMTIARLVEETILDGCAGETAAAVEASCAADTSTDPGIARSLRGIAADESRHAELAFRIVAWALASAPEEAAPAVRRALTHLRAELARAPARLEVAAGKGPLADHGVLGTTERARIRRDVLREVVIPALEQTAHLERARRREIGVEPEAGV